MITINDKKFPTHVIWNIFHEIKLQALKLMREFPIMLEKSAVTLIT